MEEIRVIAFDLDGTLTQHKSKLGERNRTILNRLSDTYKLLMVGAGQCQRIFKQMDKYPIDIIGNYGMQFCRYNPDSGELDVATDIVRPCGRESVGKRISELRERHGYTEFAGESVEYHSSGCVTFPLLGTTACLEDKLAFDPDRKKRSLFYEDVCSLFPEYNVFIGGSSSFDFVPQPYNKLYALDEYCKTNGLSRKNLVYVGDDYGRGGNDEDVYLSDIHFICVDDYLTLEERLSDLWR